MRVRWYWPDCNLGKDGWGCEPVDAFWVEASLDEATRLIFPLLDEKDVAESKRNVEEGYHITELLSGPPLPYTFLVHRNLRSIIPQVIHYPFHQLWNAYSPFVEIAEREISRLEELRDLKVTS